MKLHNIAAAAALIAATTVAIGTQPANAQDATADFGLPLVSNYQGLTMPRGEAGVLRLRGVNLADAAFAVRTPGYRVAGAIASASRASVQIVPVDTTTPAVSDASAATLVLLISNDKGRVRVPVELLTPEIVPPAT